MPVLTPLRQPKIELSTSALGAATLERTVFNPLGRELLLLACPSPLLSPPCGNINAHKKKRPQDQRTHACKYHHALFSHLVFVSF